MIRQATCQVLYEPTVDIRQACTEGSNRGGHTGIVGWNRS